MAKPSSTQTAAESDFLKRLRKAVQITGLNADLASLSPQEQSIVVTNRLAQTTVRYLTNEVDAAAGQRLSEELRALASPEEYELLMAHPGYTFVHVVQFLFEFAKTYSDVPKPEYFCVGMGRGGGGVAVEPHKEWISLIGLLITALPPAHDQRNIGVLLQWLGPLVLSQIFTGDLVHIEMRADGENQLQIHFHYANRERLAACLKPFGLEKDIGAFFMDTALHIQGTLQLYGDTFAEDPRIEMHGRIEELDNPARAEIAKACSCGWTLTWRPETRMIRLQDDGEILARSQTILEAIHRKDLEYYLERIKTLEMRVRALESEDRVHGLIGDSPQMRQVRQTIQQVAASDLTVLLLGETGTGKELAARAVHQNSLRQEKPFVAVNCAAFSETLLESELFGYEKGAFTGADRAKPGRFELAHQGTLFLDEVGDIPQVTQIKLLRVLETQAFERVGGTETIQTDVRIVAATNRDLEEMIARGEFREDFYFRLNVLPLRLPPLRERPEDIPLLAQTFLERISQRSGKVLRGFSRSAIDRLMNHAWPGNVRDLINSIERAVAVYAKGPTLTESDISHALGTQTRRPAPPLRSLSQRQRRILEVVHRQEGGSAVNEVMNRIASPASGSGDSRRTFQNDLRKLTDLGYLDWHKRGAARVYELSQDGRDLLRAQSESDIIA